MKSQTRPGQATRIIHNHRHQDAQGSPYSPVYNTTTYRFRSTQDLLAVVNGQQGGNLYTRWGTNPTIQELEQGLAQLEYAEAALAFASGMAAISATFFALGRTGILCIGDLYGGTQQLLREHCALLGIPLLSLRPGETDRLTMLLQPGMLLYCETPANPTLTILDIAALAAIAHRQGALLAVDNTFASPVNQNPLTLGADLVLHSASKYLGGHSDITAGALMASAPLVQQVAAWRTSLGQILSAETAALLARSLRTLPLRIAQHNHNAMAVAQAMAAHPRVRRVLYPGLPDFPGHGLAAQQMHGFGGMLSIEVDGDARVAAAVADRLQIFLLATSLGGVESLVSQPCFTSHYGLSAEQRQEQGISDGLLRLSVGLEDSADLIGDLEQALT